MSASPGLTANPLELPRALVGVCAVLIAAGAAAFALGLASDPATTWRAFHVNFLYFGTMSQAAIVLASALVIVGARWAGPVRHVAEGLAAWVPVSLVLFVIGTAGSNTTNTSADISKNRSRTRSFSISRARSIAIDAICANCTATCSSSSLNSPLRLSLSCRMPMRAPSLPSTAWSCRSCP